VAYRSTMRGLWLLLLAKLVVAQGMGPVPDLKTIVDGMVNARQENRAHIRPYTVKRDYQLLDVQLQPKARIVADITYLPPGQKWYSVESSSGGLGEKILRDILAKQESPSKEPLKEVSPEYYDFQYVGQEVQDGRLCYVLAITPRRDDKDLIRGKVWIDAEDYKTHMIEGEPVKSPSWWVHDLHIVMSFASVDGMWLHTFTRAVANVRFKGKYVMMSRDLEYRTAEQVATRPISQNYGQPGRRNQLDGKSRPNASTPGAYTSDTYAPNTYAPNIFSPRTQ